MRLIRSACALVPSRHVSILILLFVGIAGCSKDPTVDSKSQPEAVSADAPDAWLFEASTAAGLHFVHDPGADDGFESPQIMGPGGALFDCDGDGDLDLFLVGGGPLPGPDRPADLVPSRLFRREANGTFVDVTDESGLKNTGYGMGIAVADADNDGDLDVFLSNYGDDRFFVNRGDGTFRDHTEEAGVSDPHWSTAASFFDYDRDGWLDLVVVNYLDYSPGRPCYDYGRRREFCGITQYSGTVSRLYRNRGLGSDAGGPQFVEVTVSAGLATGAGRGLGVRCSDFNDDGRPDILVANDAEPNRLWIQQPDGTFRDEAQLRGVAVNQLGRPEANMGIIYEDLTGDGLPDVFITHLRGETNTLWRGEAGGQFADITPQTGLGPSSLRSTGFGVVATDVDLDGDLDLLIVNGHVQRQDDSGGEVAAQQVPWDKYAEPGLLYLQQTPGRFVLESRLGGKFSRERLIGRGLLAGDLDGDGDLDFISTNCHGPVRLYRNEAPHQGHWLLIRAFDPARKRDSYGAQIHVAAGELRMSREVQPSSGYLTHQDPRVHFGLGQATGIDRVVVRWPDGELEQEEFTEVSIDAVVELRRGSGRRLGKEAR